MSDRPKTGDMMCCRSSSDGECNWQWCPQNIQGEPARSGRSCPLYDWTAGEDAAEPKPYPEVKP